LKSTASDDEQCMDEAAQGSLTDSIGKFHKKSRMRLAHLATQSQPLHKAARVKARSPCAGGSGSSDSRSTLGDVIERDRGRCLIAVFFGLADPRCAWPDMSTQAHTRYITHTCTHKLLLNSTADGTTVKCDQAAVSSRSLHSLSLSTVRTTTVRLSSAVGNFGGK